MKNFFYIFVFCFFVISANAMEKETTFNQMLFDKAQSEGKVVVVSSWIKYCSSCASQMKILNISLKRNEIAVFCYFTTRNIAFCAIFDVIDFLANFAIGDWIQYSFKPMNTTSS